MSALCQKRTLVLENKARGRAMRQQASVAIGETSFRSPNSTTAIQHNAFRPYASYFWRNGPKESKFIAGIPKIIDAAGTSLIAKWQFVDVPNRVHGQEDCSSRMV